MPTEGKLCTLVAIRSLESHHKLSMCFFFQISCHGAKKSQTELILAAEILNEKHIEQSFQDYMGNHQDLLFKSTQIWSYN
jgi:hypothetical protein